MRAVRNFLVAVVLTCASAVSNAQIGLVANFSSLWWIPAESGWGIHLTHQGNVIFAALYTYDTDNQPLWLTMSNGTLQADGKTFRGDLYRVQGSPFNAAPFVPLVASDVAIVGTMSITFTSLDTGVLTYTVNGHQVTKNIQKQIFGKNSAACSFTSNADRTALLNYQDLWWNPSESGWGMSIVHQDDTLFAVAYVYDATRRPTWFIMSNGVKQANGSYVGDWLRVTGPPFDSIPFVPLSASNIASRVTKVGTASISFSNGQSGTVTYSVNNSTVTKAIVRQVFGSPVSSCRAGAPRQLLIPVGSPSTNSAQAVSVIDLTTRALSFAGVSGLLSGGCYIGNLTINGIVRFACSVGASHWDYNPATKTAVQNTSLAKLPTSTTAPVISTLNGEDIYGVGTVGTGQLLVRSGNSFVGSVPLATQATRYPKDIAYDVGNNRLFTMDDNTSNPSNPVTVERINIGTRQVEATVSEEKQGIGIAFFDGEVYLAMRRNAAGKDIVNYNASTLTKSGEGTVTISGSATQFAFAIAVDQNGVHIGTATGLQTFSHDLRTILRTTLFGTGEPSNSGVWHIAADNGKLYIIIQGATFDNVREIDSDTHVETGKWTVPGSPYRPKVIH